VSILFSTTILNLKLCIIVFRVPNAEELTYTIDLDSENVVVPFEKLVLNFKNARMLQDKNVIKNYERLSMCK